MTGKPPRIVIIAGEASGDSYGAGLASRLREIVPGADIRGTGGPKMREAGVRLLYDSSRWSAIGVSEALKLVPRLSIVLCRLGRFLRADPPDLLILIDFGAFNVRLARRVRSTVARIVYYIPPGSWNRQASYARLKGLADHVITPFPWSADALRKEGFDAHFLGHPLLDLSKPTLSTDEFHERFGFAKDRPVVALLPGSRPPEIAHNLPVLVVAAARLLRALPGLQFAIPVAPTVDAEGLARELRGVSSLRVELNSGEHVEQREREGLPSPRLAGRICNLAVKEGLTQETRVVPVTLIRGMAADVLAHSRAAAVTSGTATLEAAILGCPMVIVYRGSRSAALEFRLRGKGIKFIGMPNIVLDRLVCPELIQDQANPGRIAQELHGLIGETPEREEMLNAFARIKGVLGAPGALDRAANAIADLVGRIDQQ